jgi:hypothetical protein
MSDGFVNCAGLVPLFKEEKNVANVGKGADAEEERKRTQ